MTTTPSFDPFYDVIVVGARCAGAATAMLLARRGLRVLVLDKSAYGKDALSTHALMRGGVLQLHRWGLLDGVRAAGTPPIRTTTFHYGDDAVEVQIKPRSGCDALFAPRRTVLDPLLVDAARRDGAQVEYGQRLVGLSRCSKGRVCGVIVEGDDGRPREVRGGTVIGADGLRSTVAALVGALPYHQGKHASALIYGYWSDLEATGYHWYYQQGVSAGVIPTSGGLTCIFVAGPATSRRDDSRVSTRYARMLAEIAPGSHVLAKNARLVSPLRSFGGHPGFLRPAWGPGWALVGDAGYFKDPLTAHGITDALRDAELLARALEKDSEAALGDYQNVRDDLARPFMDHTDFVASFDWDLATLRERHLALSEAMTRSVAAIEKLEPNLVVAA